MKIISHSYQQVSHLAEIFFQAIPSFLNNRVVAAAVIAFASLAVIFAAWAYGFFARRPIQSDATDPQKVVKKKPLELDQKENALQKLDQKEKALKEAVDKINREQKIWLFIDEFLELAKTKGKEITTFNLALDQNLLTNDQLKDVVHYCPNLKSVKLSLKKLDSDGLAALVSLPKLEMLDLSSNDRIRDAELASVGLLTQLKVLNLYLCKITETGAAEIAKLTSLQKLDLGYSLDLTDKCLEPFSALKELRFLNLEHCKKVSDKGLAHLAHLPLQELSLEQCAITDLGLEHVGKMQSLRCLKLMQNDLKGSGFIHLEKLSNLKVLDLSGCTDLKDQALGHISKLPTLEEIYLAHATSVTPQGLVEMKTLSSLKKLSMQNVHQLKDDGVACLALLKSLEDLDLSNCKDITDASLVHLSALTQLKVLILSKCEKITDQGIISLSSKQIELQKIWINGCYQLSNAVIEQLKTKCQVVV